MVSGSMAQPTRIVLALARVATLLHASRAAAAPGAAIATTPARFRKSRRLDSADIPFTLRFRGGRPEDQSARQRERPRRHLSRKLHTEYGQHGICPHFLSRWNLAGDCPASDRR